MFRTAHMIVTCCYLNLYFLYVCLFIEACPKNFEENLKVTFEGEEFEFILPDPADFLVWGSQNIEEKLYTPPPFMHMEKLLTPT